MKAVLVTNGTASLSVARKLSSWTDAMNIDLKGFTDRYYRDVLQGNRRDTDVAVIYRLAEVARQRLACATTGNC
jgi:pyruvate-formate lyase-activating enzyme